MAVVKAEFNGQVFVPAEPVELPPGTKVDIVLPPRTPTEEENRRWRALLDKLDATEPHFRTLEEAMQYLRKRP